MSAIPQTEQARAVQFLYSGDSDPELVRAAVFAETARPCKQEKDA